MPFTRPAPPLEVNTANTIMPSPVVWALGTTGSMTSFGRAAKEMTFVTSAEGDGGALNTMSTTETANLFPQNRGYSHFRVPLSDGMESGTFTRVWRFRPPGAIQARVHLWLSGEPAGTEAMDGYGHIEITPEAQLHFNRSNIAELVNIQGQILLGDWNTVAISRDGSSGGGAISINGNPAIGYVAAPILFGNAEQIGNHQWRGNFLQSGVELEFYAQSQTAASNEDLQILSQNAAQITRTVPGTSAVVPGAPTITGITQTTTANPAAMAIAFTVPASDGGSAIDAYRYTVNPADSLGRTTIDTNTTNPKNLSFAPDVEYTISMQAHNAAGFGASSNSMTFTPSSAAVVTPPTQTGAHSMVLTNATFGPGKFGQALTAGRGLVNPSPLPVDKTKTFHIEFWFKHADVNRGRSTLFDQPGAFNLWLDGNTNPQMSMPGGGTDTRYNSFFNNQWLHGYLVFEAEKNYVYFSVNGKWCTGINTNFKTSGYNPTANGLTIGADAAGNNPWGGELDLVSIGYGDKYANGIVVPEQPTNTLQSGLLAMYLLDGDGNDAAGSTGTYANGNITFRELAGQTLVLSGPTYNGVTSGKVTLSPALANANGAIAKQVDMVITGNTWSARLEKIVPGNYGAEKLEFANSAGTGIPLYGEPFSVIVISGGGSLAASTEGGALAASALKLTALDSSGTVGTTHQITVTTDNPLVGGQTEVVTFGSPKGTFNPAQVTLNAATGTATTQYTVTDAGAHVLTATAAGSPAVTSATVNFVGVAPVVVPPSAPTVSITTAVDKIMSGKRGTIAGTVNLQGDANGKVVVTLLPQPSGTAIALGTLSGAADITGSAFVKQGDVLPGLYKGSAKATANGQTTEALTAEFRVLDLVGDFSLPA